MKPKRVTSLFTVLFFVTVITLSTNYKAAHISAATDKPAMPPPITSTSKHCIIKPFRYLSNSCKFPAIPLPGLYSVLSGVEYR